MSVSIGTCKECQQVKEFTIESVLYKRNKGERFSFICSSCSGKPSCSLCDNDECPLYKCVVCKHAEKRICEKCNDECNHSEPWKCGTCKQGKSDKSEYINRCIKLHTLLESIEKDNEDMKKSKETILRHEKEIDRLTSEIGNLRKKMQNMESKMEQKQKDSKRYADECLTVFKKIKL